MAIRQELLEELLKDYKSPEDLLGQGGLLKELTKALVEKALDGELTHHLGYPKHSSSKSDNARNGKSKKGLLTDHGRMEIVSPRDRNGSFEPELVKKRQTRFDGFDDKILSMYARGMTVREIQGHLEDIYAVEVSPDLISSVTDSVLEEVKAWQNRTLDAVYPIVFMDALRVKIRDSGHVINKAVYMALGVNLDGHKEVLGLWVAKEEGAKFWLKVVTELKNRGVKDMFIACVDGLKGFPEAIESVYPETQVQLCIVHMVRNSLRFVPWKDKKAVVADLKTIYTATNAEVAKESLNAFRTKWDEKYPTIADSWERNWEGLVPFLSYPDYIRKAIYTTNAIESLNRSLRKISKNRGSFPNDESALKLLYLALRNISKKWTMPIRLWKQALNQFVILFPGRLIEN
ncbi:MAG: IS256 family transposase [Deltaproteobacteria bacterium]|nr:IS256 family transposase [Deltaproteobacteria bacterium]